MLLVFACLVLGLRGTKGHLFVLYRWRWMVVVRQSESPEWEDNEPHYGFLAMLPYLRLF